MSVPQGLICLDDRELESLTLQQATQQSKERNVMTQDIYTVFNAIKGEGGKKEI